MGISPPGRRRLSAHLAAVPVADLDEVTHGRRHPRRIPFSLNFSKCLAGFSTPDSAKVICTCATYLRTSNYFCHLGHFFRVFASFFAGDSAKVRPGCAPYLRTSIFFRYFAENLSKMPLNKNQLLRIRTLDRCLQRGQLHTLPELIDKVSEALFCNVSRRTVQNDIQLMRSGELGFEAPIEVRNNKYYTYSDPDFSITKMPLADVELTALRGAVDILRHFQVFPQIAPASDLIARLEEFMTLPGADRHPAILLENNERTAGLKYIAPIYEAICARRPLRIIYRPFLAREAREICVSPYLLKEWRNRWYLLCARTADASRPTLLPLDRMEGIETDDEAQFNAVPGFDPWTYFDATIGVSRAEDETPKRVLIKVTAREAPYLLTKPLHHTQRKVKDLPDGSVVIELNVIPNVELERELLSYGAHIEVLAPASLRASIGQQLRTAAAPYPN